MENKEARPKYTTVIFCKHWVNGSGWSYETILNVEESDYNLKTLDWDDILFWLVDDDDEGIKVIADDSEEDNLITIVLYDAADYEENNTDAAEIERVERWESEIAKEYLAKTAD